MVTHHLIIYGMWFSKLYLFHRTLFRECELSVSEKDEPHSGWLCFKTANCIAHCERPLSLFNFLAAEFIFQGLGLGIGLPIPVSKAAADFWNCRLGWESTCHGLRILPSGRSGPSSPSPQYSLPCQTSLVKYSFLFAFWTCEEPRLQQPLCYTVSC